MKITISSQQLKDRACEVIQALSLEKQMVVTISEYKKNRSVAQNSLYWKWITILAGEEGETKEFIHQDRKRRFLCVIYERDLPEYAEMIQTVRKMYSAGFKDDSVRLHDYIVNLTSTTTATMAQFSEYLDDLDKDAMQSGIYLERTEDMYMEAMGK